MADSVPDTLLNILSKEASDTDMVNEQLGGTLKGQKPIKTERLEKEASDELLEKITNQLQGILGKVEGSSTKNINNIDTEQELENIVSSALLEGNDMKEIRDVVSETLSELKKKNSDDASIARVNQAEKILTDITVDSGSQMEKDKAVKKQPTTIMVKKGESLFKIALRIYGNGNKYLQLYEANKENITDPNILHVGQVLMVPK